MPQVVNVNCTFDNHIIITLKEGHRLFASYIPPSDSIHYKDEYFFDIPALFSPIDNNRVYIGGGDLNSWISNSLQIPTNFNGVYRPNPDTFLKSHGRILRNICKNCNCYLLNNLELYSVVQCSTAILPLRDRLIDRKMTFAYQIQLDSYSWPPVQFLWS